MANRWGNSGNSDRLFFLGSKITADGDCSHEIKTFAPWKKSYDHHRQYIKKQRRYFTNRVFQSSQSYGFSSSHVWMWELCHKESWVLKNWCFWTVVLEKTLESPLDCKEIQPVHPKGNQSWIFTGRTNAEAETSILWPPDAKNWLVGKDSDAGKDWRQNEKRTKEDEMVGWHHKLNGNDFEQVLGVGDGRGSLACCSPWVAESAMTATELNWTLYKCVTLWHYLHLQCCTYDGVIHLPSARHPGMWSQVGLRKHHYKQT